MPDALAGFAASAALAASDIPFDGPISEVRVARINGEYVVNPTFKQLEQADMDIMVGATEDNIMMVEGEMDEVPESALLEALKVAHEAIKPMCQLQKELSKELGTDVKREYDDEINDEELRQQVKDECYAPAYAIAEPATTTSTSAKKPSPKFAKTSKNAMLPLTPNSRPTKSKKRTRSLTATTTTWNAMPCAVASSTKASVSTDVKSPPTSAPSGAKCRPCHASRFVNLYPWRNSGFGYRNTRYETR